MGMYTQLKLAVTLKEDTPQSILNTIQYMLDGGIGKELPVSDHPLFQTHRWTWMLTCSSAYFDEGSSHSFSDRYLTVVCDFKNYTGELTYFLDWIMPYVYGAPGTVLGSHQYEEDDQPTLIYKA